MCSNQIESEAAFLSRDWLKLCFSAIIFFTIFHIFFKCDEPYTPLPFVLCHEGIINERVRLGYLCSLLTFSIKSFLVLSKWLSTGKEAIASAFDFSGICAMNLAVSGLAGISNFLAMYRYWGGTLVDNFGVGTPVTQLIEWFTCIPLMIIFIITTDVRPSLTRTDVFNLVLISLEMISIGIIRFLKISQNDIYTTIAIYSFHVIITFEFLSNVPAWVLTKYNYYLIKKDDNLILNCYSEIRQLLIFILFCTFSTFSIIYYISMYKVISSDDTVIMFIVTNTVSKMIFMTAAMDSHTKLIYNGYQTQLKSSASKQAYLRYIMHEVRVPLSSLTLGLGILSVLEGVHNRAKALESDNFCNDNKQGPFAMSENDNNNNNNKMAITACSMKMLKLDNDKFIEMLEAISIMKDATSFMADTINSVLDMQKIEDGKMELTFTPFSIRLVVLKVSKTLRGPLTDKHIHLNINVANDVPMNLIGDHFKIAHVLANFLSNAIKFSAHGAVIDILVTLVDSNQASDMATGGDGLVHVKFAVHDYGVGIDILDQEKLFQPFMQIRPNELQQGGGSGVGLYICKQIVELHGGHVGCISMPNQGSTFFFILPLQVCTDVILSNTMTAFNEVTNLQRGNGSSDFTRVSGHCSVSEALAVCTGSGVGGCVGTDQGHNDEDNEGDGEHSETRSDESTLSQVTSPATSSTSGSRRRGSGSSAGKETVEWFLDTLDQGDGSRSVVSTETGSTTQPATSVKHVATTGLHDVRNYSSVGFASSSSTGYESAIGTCTSPVPGLFENQVLLSPDLALDVSNDTLQALSSGSFRSKESEGLNESPKSKKMKNALVVEDVKSNRRLLVMLLNRASIRCEEAEDGAIAVAMVKASLDSYDVLFMDNLMPHMNGVDATRAIRGQGYKKLIIGLTGNALDTDVKEFTDAGADLVLAKPLRPELLTQLLDYTEKCGCASTDGMKLKVIDGKIVPVQIIMSP